MPAWRPESGRLDFPSCVPSCVRSCVPPRLVLDESTKTWVWEVAGKQLPADVQGSLSSSQCCLTLTLTTKHPHPTLPPPPSPSEPPMPRNGRGNGDLTMASNPESGRYASAVITTESNQCETRLPPLHTFMPHFGITSFQHEIPYHRNTLLWDVLRIGPSCGKPPMGHPPMGQPPVG